MHKSWEDMIEKRLPSAAQRPLPFPCLITKLIISSGILLPEQANLDRSIPVFGLAQWTQSISHMPQLGEPQVNMEVNDARVEETHEGEHSSPGQASAPSSVANFSLLQSQLDTLVGEMRDTRNQMRETLTEILARQSAMEDMLRQILGRLPPPPDAAP
jgi:hypothetical protein